jgi:farnesyl-diphosphate farnesyltransferase
MPRTEDKIMRTSGVQAPVSDYEERALREVSRSFALTIPQLPPKLRRQVTNAYLLCRIIDTIEDDESLSPDRKNFYFQEFLQVLDRKRPAGKFADSLYPLLSGRTLPEERDLIRNTPRVVETTWSFSPKQQAAMKRCCGTMVRGMEGFQLARNPGGLRDVAEFHRYCYHVAGVVGEMLTELFCEYSPEIAGHRKKLLSLAPSFGQGLQMTNIIKDLWEDRAHGSCWLPQDVFRAAGYDLQNLSPGHYTEAFGEGLGVLIGMARGHLQNALAYTMIIPPRETGIRKFCLWAIGMAVFTLRKINRKRDYRSGQEVKISRRSVKAIIVLSNASLRSDFIVRNLFGLSTRGLPPPRPIPAA